MQSHESASESFSVGEVMETWNRQRSQDELASFVLGRLSSMDDIELGI